MRRTASKALPREAACACGWAYPIVLANLAHPIVHADRSIENEPGGHLYRCPACQDLYSITPVGRTRHRDPAQPSRPQATPEDREPREAHRARVPSDTESLWDKGEPGGPA